MDNKSVIPVDNEKSNQIDLMRRTLLRGGAKLAYIAPLVLASIKAAEGAYPSAGTGTGSGGTGTSGGSGTGGTKPCSTTPSTSGGVTPIC